MNKYRIKRWFTLLELLIYIWISMFLLSTTLVYYFETKKNIWDSYVQQNIINNINLNYNKKTNIYLYNLDKPTLSYIDENSLSTINNCDSDSCLQNYLKANYLNSIYNEAFVIENVILSKNVYKDTLVYNYLITVNIPNKDIKTGNQKFYQTVALQELRDITDNSIIDSNYVLRDVAIFLNTKINSWLYQLDVKITNGKEFFIYLVTNIQDKNNFY